MSDVTGLALALAAQACLATAFVRRRSGADADPETIAASGRMIVAGALIAGLAVGVRTQTAWLTLPLLALVLVDRAGRGAAGAILGSAMTFSIGVLVWAIPMIVASGGVGQYRAALAGQSAEQFHGLDIFLSNPTPRRMALGILASLVGPWAFPPLGWVRCHRRICGVCCISRGARRGLQRCCSWRLFRMRSSISSFKRRTAAMRCRSCLRLRYLVVRGLSLGGTMVATLGSAAIIVVSLVVTLPSARTYAENPSPAYEAVEDLRHLLSNQPGVIGAHQRFARVLETRDVRPDKNSAVTCDERVDASWRRTGWAAGTAPVWYLADPARGDLELVDPLSARVHEHYAWKFPRESFMSGVRPDVVDLVRIDSPPGWFAETGWHLTPETLNFSERQGRSEGIAHVRRRPEAALLVIGAESTEPAGGKPARVKVSIDDRAIEEWDAAGGRPFLEACAARAGSARRRRPVQPPGGVI